MAIGGSEQRLSRRAAVAPWQPDGANRAPADPDGRPGPRGGGLPVRRPGLLLIALTLVAALSVFAGSANAAFRHPTLAGSFGTDGTAATSIGNPQQLAINQTTQTLYVQGNEAPAIYAFHIPAAGTHTPTGGAFPLTTPAGGGDPDIGVDSTGGNIYYVSEGTQTLYGYSSAGAELGGFPIKLPGDNCGAAVNSQGDVAEANYNEGSVNLYEPNGVFLKSISVAATGSPCHIEFDRANDDLYVANYGGGVFKYTKASNYTVHSEVTSDTARGLAVDASSGALYVTTYEKVEAFSRGGVPLETFANNVLNANLRGIAVDESTGVVYVGNLNSGKILVYPGVIIPDVTTGEPISNNEVAGHIDPAGGGEVINCRVEYGETTSYGELAPCSPAAPYSTATDVTATLLGLVGEHVYHYRFVASNSNGTSVGEDKTISPHYVKALHTDTATAISRNCATLNGSFEGNGEDTHYYFEYGKTGTYGSNTATPPGADAGSGSGTQNLHSEVCGLEPGTTYHYRVVASNSQGTSAANDVTFGTVTAVEFLTTEMATLPNASEAVLHGSYLGNGEDTSWFFEWGYTTFYGNKTTEVDEGTRTGHIAVSAMIGELFPGTTYHFRVVGKNATGFAYGEDLSFTTGLLPEVAMLPIADAKELAGGARGVTLRGTVNPKQGEGTVYHFEYGPTASYGTSTPSTGPLPTDGEPHPASAEVTGLAPGVVYHYRLVATSNEGTTYGPDTTYQAIPNLPTVVGSSVSDIGINAATVNATVRPGNGATAVIIDYGTTDGYGKTTRAEGSLPSDESDHAVSRMLSGLQPNTTYHYRVTAINFSGTTHGPDQTFGTASLPSILSQGASGIGQTGATLDASISPNLLATTYHFEYGPKGSMTASTPESGSIGSDRDGHSVTWHLGGLAAGSTYQYRVVATNSLGSTAGSIATFTTAPVPAQRTVKCKKGQVLKKGKCVKKQTKKKHKKKHKKKTHKKSAKQGGGKR